MTLIIVSDRNLVNHLRRFARMTSRGIWRRKPANKRAKGACRPYLTESLEEVRGGPMAGCITRSSDPVNEPCRMSLCCYHNRRRRLGRAQGIRLVRNSADLRERTQRA